MSFTVRQATDGDSRRVAEVFAATIGTSANCCDQAPTPSQWSAAIREDRARCWFAVGERRAEIAGWVQLKPWTTRPDLDRVSEIVLYVDEPHRRSTVAAHLLFAAIERARIDDQIDHLMAVVVSSNQSSSRGLAAAGFNTVARLNGVVQIGGQKESVDWLLMDLHAHPTRIYSRWSGRVPPIHNASAFDVPPQEVTA